MFRHYRLETEKLTAMEKGRRYEGTKATGQRPTTIENRTKKIPGLILQFPPPLISVKIKMVRMSTRKIEPCAGKKDLDFSLLLQRFKTQTLTIIKEFPAGQRDGGHDTKAGAGTDQKHNQNLIFNRIHG